MVGDGDGRPLGADEGSMVGGDEMVGVFVGPALGWGDGSNEGDADGSGVGP